jgi:hypothetical protein
MGNMDFNPEGIDTSSQFSVLPAGWYTGQVTNSEIRDTKAGDGRMLWLEFTITAGPQENFKSRDWINFDNPSVQATEIGKKQLAKLVKACGLASIGDHEELRFKTVQFHLKVVPAQGQYEESNSINDYRPVGDTPAPEKPAPPQATPPPAAVDKPKKGGAKPWEK